EAVLYSTHASATACLNSRSLCGSMRRLSGIFLGFATAMGINLRLSPQAIVLWKTYCGGGNHAAASLAFAIISTLGNWPQHEDVVTNSGTSTQRTLSSSPFQSARDTSRRMNCCFCFAVMARATNDTRKVIVSAHG